MRCYECARKGKSAESDDGPSGQCYWALAGNALESPKGQCLMKEKRMKWSAEEAPAIGNLKCFSRIFGKKSSMKFRSVLFKNKTDPKYFLLRLSKILRFRFCCFKKQAPFSKTAVRNSQALISFLKRWFISTVFGSIISGKKVNTKKDLIIGFGT